MTFWHDLLLVVIPVLLAGIGFVIKSNWKSISIWLRRKKLKIFPVNFNIAFSIKFNEGLNSGRYFSEIKKNFYNLLDELNMSNIIKVRDFSDIQKFRTTKEAEDFRNEKNIDLIIWGDFSEDFLKENDKIVNKLNLNFTLSHPEDREGRTKSLVLSDIKSNLAIKNYWKIFDENSLNDINIISKNLFDLSIYIVAFTLKLYGRIWKSITLFKKLHNKLAEEEDKFNERVKQHLINCYHLIIIDSLRNERKYSIGRDFCKKILILKERDLPAISSLAIFNYKMGKVDESKENIDLLVTHFPKLPVTELNLAFFRILEKKYKNAYNHYEKLINFKTINFNPLEACEFLDEEHKKSKEPALLYASGILSHYFCGDNDIARKDLQLFIKKSRGSKYKQMKRKAKNILNEIQ